MIELTPTELKALWHDLVVSAVAGSATSGAVTQDGPNAIAQRAVSVADAVTAIIKTAAESTGRFP